MKRCAKRKTARKVVSLRPAQIEIYTVAAYRCIIAAAVVGQHKAYTRNSGLSVEFGKGWGIVRLLVAFAYDYF